MRNFRIGRLKDRFVVTWLDERHVRRRHRLEADTLRDAEREALDVIKREAQPVLSSTVRDLWAAYIAHLGSRPTAETMGYTGKAVLAHFGALRPDQITIAHCREYAKTRGASTGTVWTELGHLSSCLHWAVKVKLIPAAPYIERPQKPSPKERFLTREEIGRLLAVPSVPHIRLAILLMLGTAGRIGAILELTWDRVDFDRGQINLRLDAEGPRKGRAIVPMGEGLRQELLEAKRGALTDHVIEWSGKPVSSIRTGFTAAVREAQLANVSQHTLRHTAAVHMAVAGVPMSQISQYLGHSSTAVTERVYARFSPDHLRAAAQVLDFSVR